jgi:hypothetical protein
MSIHDAPFRFETVHHDRYKYALLEPSLSIYVPIKGHECEIRGDDGTLYAKLERDGRLTAYQGYHWDGASGPAIDTKTNMRASLFHDVLYQMMRMAILPYVYKDTSDRVLQALCIQDGMMKARAQWFYLGVKRGGFSAAWPAHLYQ